MRRWAIWTSRPYRKRVSISHFSFGGKVSQLDGLKKAKSIHDIAALLGYKAHTLAYVIYKIPEDRKYTIFTIPKKSGGVREIKAPIPHLKELQRRLANLLTLCLQEIEVFSQDKRLSQGFKKDKPLAHGFKKGLSIATNAYMHRKRRYVLNVDLSNFFPSINFGRVRGFFISSRYFRLDPKIATIIAQIACHQNQLPQGSPCSPIISNLVGHLLDLRLAQLAKRYKCTYSRYADDLTFSSNLKTFPEAIARQQVGLLPDWSAGAELVKRISKAGFRLNSKKTRMQYKISRQLVTGLVVNQKVNTKADYYRVARSMCHSLFRTGQFYHVISSTNDAAVPKGLFLFRFIKSLCRKLLQRFGRLLGKRKKNIVLMAELGTMSELEGMLNYIYSIKKFSKNYAKKSHSRNVQKSHNTLITFDKSSETTEKYFEGIKKLYFKFLFFKNFYGLEKPLVLCEGKTDYVYLKCALQSLANEFPSLISIVDKKIIYGVRFLNYSSSTKEILGLTGGSAGLAKLVRFYKENINFYSCLGKRYPVIILVDNDSGASGILSAVKAVTGVKELDPAQPFYQVIENLYVLPTPKAAGGEDSKIEDCFTQETLQTVIGGKTFDPNIDGHENTAHYGKHIFAEAVVKKNKGTIDFSGFKALLNPMRDVLGDYQTRLHPMN